MRSSRNRVPDIAGFVPVLLANLVPLVGVVVFGWEASTVVVIYVLEVLWSFPLAGAKALFAQRPPRTDRESIYDLSEAVLVNKRGSLKPVSWLPPVHPRNVPFALAVAGGAGWFAVFVGFVLGPELPLVDAVLRPEVVVSLAALAVGQLVEIGRDYIGDGRYETTSPFAVVETPARQALFLTALLFVVPAVGDRVDLAVGAFVVGKLVIEWSAFRATHGTEGRLTAWLSGPDTPAERPDRPQVPDSAPTAVVSTADRAVWLTAVGRTLTTVVPRYLKPFVIAWLVSVAVISWSGRSGTAVTGVTVALFGLFAAALAAKTAAYYYRYGPLEYRRYGDRLVAYDTWLDEPQWSTPIDVLRDVEIVGNRLADRLLDTRTISLTTGWGDDETERTVGPIAEPEQLLTAFELPIRSTELPAVDRRLAAGAVGTAGVVGGLVGLAVVGPWASTGAVLNLLFLLPVLLLAPVGLWRRAASER
ncbi:MAG: DUF6498-containing protein [Euryarchaeota archaeon]|nr:DUF6498-containing protein [Euryarchaeota archaeon]